MKRGALGLALATFAVSGVAGAAAGPDGGTKSLPCRPTIACTADIVEPGAFELETGMLFRRLDASGSQWSFPFLAKLTLARWAQLQVGSNGFTTEHGAGNARFFDDVAPGVKFHLVDQRALTPALSASVALAIPTVSDQLGYDGVYDALFIAYITKDLGPVHADLNLGLSDFALGAGSASLQEWAALALSMNLPPPFGVMVEEYFFADASPWATKDRTGFLFALSASPRPWLVFDFGGDVGYFPSERAYSAFVGMTIVPVHHLFD